MSNQAGCSYDVDDDDDVVFVGMGPKRTADEAAGCDMYTLDACSCRFPAADLRTTVSSAVEAALEATTAQATLSRLCCPRAHCGKLLSNRDMCQLIDRQLFQQLAAAIQQRVCALVATSMPSSAEHCCDCGAQLLPPTLPLVDPAGKQLSLRSTRAALKARELPPAGSLPDCQQRLVAHLRQKGVHLFCPACPLDLLPQASSSSSAALTPEVGATISACSQLQSAITNLQQLLATGGLQQQRGSSSAVTGDAGAASTSAAAGGRSTRSGRRQPRQRTPKAARGGGRGSKAAEGRGVGYGGSHHVPDSSSSMQAASAKEKEVDAALLQQLERVQALLSSGGGQPQQAGSTPLALCCLVHAGPLVFCLRSLLQNDSLQDICSRKALYCGLLRLLRVLGASMDLLPALQVAAVNPDDPASDPAATPSLMHLMERLNTQCGVYKRAAGQLVGEEEDSTQELSVVLDIASMCDDLAADLRMFNAAMASSRQEQRETGPPAAKRAAAEPQQAEYREALRQLAFTETPLEKDHYFRQQAAAGGSTGGGEQMRQRLKRICREIATLSTSLPLHWGSSVLLAVDDGRMDLLRACIFPAADTPYANGAFLFDLWLPPEYPNAPPKVQFLTTGGGTVRFNPNLYECGKVCLSLLGTWAGPSWQPGISTLLQVLMSIQSMIFVSDPFFNEPGYESTMHTPHGKAQSAAYNRDVRCNALRLAVLQQLRRPCPTFAEATCAHFRLKSVEVIAQCDAWQAEDAGAASSSHRAAGGRGGGRQPPQHSLANVCTQIKEELAKLSDGGAGDVIEV